MQSKHACCYPGELVLADGQSEPFDKLLLATGAEPNRLNVPGSDFPQVQVPRRFRDCRQIVERATKSKAAVVIGASFIGLEVAASLRKRGLEVDVVVPRQATSGKDIRTRAWREREN